MKMELELIVDRLPQAKSDEQHVVQYFRDHLTKYFSAEHAKHFVWNDILDSRAGWGEGNSYIPSSWNLALEQEMIGLPTPISTTCQGHLLVIKSVSYLHQNEDVGCTVSESNYLFVDRFTN